MLKDVLYLLFATVYVAVLTAAYIAISIPLLAHMPAWNWVTERWISALCTYVDTAIAVRN